MQELFKAIPQVSAIIDSSEFVKKYGHFKQDFVTNLLRDGLETVRNLIKDGKIKDVEGVEKAVARTIEKKTFNTSEFFFKKGY